MKILEIIFLFDANIIRISFLSSINVSDSNFYNKETIVNTLNPQSHPAKLLKDPHEVEDLRGSRRTAKNARANAGEGISDSRVGGTHRMFHDYVRRSTRTVWEDFH